MVKVITPADEQGVELGAGTAGTAIDSATAENEDPGDAGALACAGLLLGRGGAP